LLADLCRQLVRLISVVRAEASQEARAAAVAAFADLRQAIDQLSEPA